MKLVKPKDSELYQYCVEDFLYNALVWCLCLAFGVVIGMFRCMLLFMAIAVPLRSYAGGMHCSTRLRCLFISISINIFVFALPVLVSPILLSNIILWTLGFNVIVICCLAPVEDLRKTLNTQERKHYRKRSVLICSFSILFAIVCYYGQFYNATYFSGVASTVTATQLIAGSLKNRYQKQSQNC